MTDPAASDCLDRLERYRPLLSPGEMDALVEAVQRAPVPAIRVNTLKISEADARATWPTWYGWTVEPVLFCPAGWQITAQDQPPGQTLEYDNGLYYIQDAASMLPVELFSLAEDPPVILDMAAAPGGKTTHLAARYGDQGVILANDTSGKRLAALRANLQSWGAVSALITNFPGERLGRWFPETFDRVLLDAPCSGDTLRISTGRRSRSVSDRERDHLCQRQESLLASAFQAVRPGGEIVYATCTLAPEEDEAVLDALLRAYPQQAEIDVIEHMPELAHAGGVVSDGKRAYHSGVSHAIRLWPHHFRTSGFFAARIRKTDSVAVPPDSPPVRAWDQTQLTRKACAAIYDSLQAAYGVDLRAVLESAGWGLWQRDKSVFAIPDMLVTRFDGVPHLSAGLMIGQFMGDQFVPSHELITRFDAHFPGGRVTLADDDLIAAWIEGHDLREGFALDGMQGAVVLLEDDRGRFLGRGKVLPNRLRNLRPKRLKG